MRGPLRPTLYTGLAKSSEYCACGRMQVALCDWAPESRITPIVLRESATGKIVKCKGCNGGKPIA